MQQFLMPAVVAVVAGGTAWLVSGSLASTIGAAIGGAIAVFIVQKRQAPPS